MIRLSEPIAKEDHVLGLDSAPITLVEYGDFQCPFCASAYWKLKSLEADVGDSMRLVFRHFPLTKLHEFALLGAMTAEAAGRQGKFWAMHDLLFENQARLGPDAVFELAQLLRLDLERFQSDLNDSNLTSRIQRDVMSGVRSGVNGTPSYFVNGDKYEGAISSASLQPAQWS